MQTEWRDDQTPCQRAKLHRKTKTIFVYVLSIYRMLKKNFMQQRCSSAKKVLVKFHFFALAEEKQHIRVKSSEIFNLIRVIPTAFPVRFRASSHPVNFVIWQSFHCFKFEHQKDPSFAKALRLSSLKKCSLKL